MSGTGRTAMTEKSPRVAGWSASYHLEILTRATTPLACLPISPGLVLRHSEMDLLVQGLDGVPLRWSPERVWMSPKSKVLWYWVTAKQ